MKLTRIKTDGSKTKRTRNTLSSVDLASSDFIFSRSFFYFQRFKPTTSQFLSMPPSASSRNRSEMNLCRCGLSAKIFTSWTNNNPGRRFYGCQSYQKGRTDHCDYFDWLDEGGVDGWPKEALIRARDEIREKDKVINQLTTQLMELRLELDKHKVEISSEGSEDENSSVESDHKVGWMQKILGKMSISNA